MINLLFLKEIITKDTYLFLFNVSLDANVELNVGQFFFCKSLATLYQVSTRLPCFSSDLDAVDQGSRHARRSLRTHFCWNCQVKD